MANDFMRNNMYGTQIDPISALTVRMGELDGQLKKYSFSATELFTTHNALDNNYIDNSGVLHSLNTYQVSDYIQVQPNTAYTINQSASGQSLFGCWYDANKVLIRGLTGLTDTSPANAAYARININKTLTIPNYSFASFSISLNGWSGKKANFLGDSITWGYNGGSNPAYANNFPNVVGQLLGLSVVNNYGASGTAIQSNAADNMSSASFTNRYVNMSNDADLIFVFGGTNDFGHNLPLGNAGTYEVDTLTVTTGATTAGNVTITLNGVANTVAVAASDSASTVASKIASTLYNGWNAKANGNIVTFTSANFGSNSAPTFSAGTTGTAASFSVTVAGVAQDTTDGTFYGGLNVLMGGLLTKYTHRTIVFATPLHRNYSDSGQFQAGEVNKSGYTLLQYVNAMKTVAQQYSIPVLDLYGMSGLLPSNSSLNATYFVDGLHPNEIGHKVIATKIVKFLNSI